MARKSENYFEFEWDEGNVNKSWIKHGVGAKECEEVFIDLNAVVSEDPKHSQKEQRWLILGKTRKGRNLIVIFTKRNSFIRVISARPMNRKERRLYEGQKT